MLITPTVVKGLRYVFVKPFYHFSIKTGLIYIKKAIILQAMLLIKSFMKLHEEHC